MMIPRLSLLTTGFLALALSTSVPVARELTLVQRFEAQRAIEQVYWEHRTWPTADARKPDLESLISRSERDTKVWRYLVESQALEDIWLQPISAMHLQAELDRMVQETRDAARLAELFSVLGNDPDLIAECLARPIVAEREVRERFRL